MLQILLGKRYESNASAGSYEEACKTCGTAASPNSLNKARILAFLYPELINVRLERKADQDPEEEDQKNRNMIQWKAGLAGDVARQRTWIKKEQEKNIVSADTRPRCHQSHRNLRVEKEKWGKGMGQAIPNRPFRKASTRRGYQGTREGVGQVVRLDANQRLRMQPQPDH